MMNGCGCIITDLESDYECLLYRANHYVMQQKWNTIKICYECGEEIRPGDKYLCTFAVWSDLSSTLSDECHFCKICQELAKHFFCNGIWCHGALFDDIQIHLEESINAECCYDGLSPAAANKIEEKVWPHMLTEDALADEEIEAMKAGE